MPFCSAVLMVLSVLMKHVSYIVGTGLFEDFWEAASQISVFPYEKAFCKIDCIHINLCVEFVIEQFSRYEGISFQPVNTLNCVVTSIPQAQPTIFWCCSLWCAL